MPSDLVKKICATPHDDDLRDERAAQLESNLLEWGEFIRLQMEQYRLAKAGQQISPEKLRRINALGQDHVVWIRGLYTLVDSYRFHRGFPEEITVSAGRLLENGRQIFTVAPVTMLEVYDVGEHLEPILAMPQMAQLLALRIRDEELGDEGVRRIAATEFPRLVFLDISHNGVTPLGVGALADSPHLPELRYLGYQGNEGDPSPFQRGVEATGSVHLWDMTSERRRIPDLSRWLSEICANPHDDGLREEFARHLETAGDPGAEFVRLQLEDYRHRRDGGFLGRGPKRRMKRLREEHPPPWVRDLDALVDAYEFRRGFPERIDVTASSLVRSAEEIFELAPVTSLRVLEVDDQFADVLAIPRLSQLLELRLPWAEIGDEGAMRLADTDFPNLRNLDLRFNDVGEEGAEALAASDCLPNLKYVDFRGNACEPAPVARGIDALDGSVQDWNNSPLNRRLREEYGEKPWLVAVYAYPPDPFELL